MHCATLSHGVMVFEEVTGMRRAEPKAEVKAVAEKVWALPYLERISLLTLTVIAREPDALASVMGLIALVSTMSDSCGAEKKVMIAEQLRGAADLLDHELIDNAAEIALMSRD
jgi:hypothetical protein